MELWIRSQNKRMLTKLDYCYLEPVHKREILGGNHYLINQSLGIYPTEKRALEILDEIQYAILCSSASPEELKELKIEFKSWYATNIKTGVVIYQMPEE